MNPDELISRMKRSTFSGFTMKEKQVRKLVQIIENETKNKQQLLSELEQSGSKFDNFERESQQLKSQLLDLSAGLDEIRTALRNERKLKEEAEEKYNSLSAKYDDLEILAMKQYDLALEEKRQSDKKLLELTDELEKYTQIRKGVEQPATSSGRSMSELTEPSSSEEALTDKASKSDHFEKALAKISQNHNFVAKAFDAAKQGFKQGILEAIGDLERSLKEL